MPARPSERSRAVGVRARLLVRAVLTLLAAVFSHSACAIFIVNEPWVRPAAKPLSTEAYMRLTSTEGATLVGVRSFAARKVAIRAPGPGKNLVVELALPPREEIVLAPDSYRLELRGLSQALKLGQYVPLSLTLRNADGSTQEISINAEVRRHSPREDEGSEHAHRTHHH